MRPLQIIRHLTICLGMLCLFGVGAANAAPVCSQVFAQNSLSEDARYALIDDLAQMKLQLDHSRLNGALTLAEKSLEAEFQKRFEEAFSLYEGTLTKAEFKDFIRIQISKRQNLEQKKEEVREEQKQALTELLLVDNFSVEQRQPDVIPDTMQYVPAIDGLVMKANNGLYKYELKSQKTDLLLRVSPLIYQVSGSSLIYLTKSGQFVSRDLNSGAEEVVFENTFKKHHWETSKSLSKDGSWLVLEDNGMSTLTLFNSKTKEITKLKNLIEKDSFLERYVIRKYFRDYIERFEFISANELLVFTSRGKAMVVNLATGDRTDVDWPEQFRREFWTKITDDGYMIIGKFRTLGIVKLTDLVKIKTHIKLQNFIGSFYDIVKLNNGTLVANMFESSHDFYTIEAQTLERSENPVIVDVYQRSLSATMAVDRKGGRFFVGGWTREGLPKSSLNMLPIIEIYTAKKDLK